MGAQAGACRAAVRPSPGGAAGQLTPATLATGLQLAAVALTDLPAGRQPWAAQLAVALAAVGMHVDLQAPRPLCVTQLQRAALQRHLQEVSAAAARPGASKLAHYLATAWGGQLPPAEEHAPGPAAYLAAVRQRARCAALAQLRTGPTGLPRIGGGWSSSPGRCARAPTAAGRRGCAACFVRLHSVWAGALLLPRLVCSPPVRVLAAEPGAPVHCGGRVHPAIACSPRPPPAQRWRRQGVRRPDSPLPLEWNACQQSSITAASLIGLHVWVLVTCALYTVQAN